MNNDLKDNDIFDDFQFETLRNNSDPPIDELSISSIHSSFTSFEKLETEKGLFNIACTNARSLTNKIASLVTLFEENNLHVALLTETWLTGKICTKRNMDNLTAGANISFIRRDRGSRGGGVAIAYDNTKIRLSKFPFEKDKTKEIICAVGSCALSRRKFAFISAYLPPSISSAELDGDIYTHWSILLIIYF